MTIRENNNDDDDDDDEEELMRVFTWRVDGHEYKLPMKKILVCSSSQQSRLVVITVNVFNLSIVKKNLNKFRLGWNSKPGPFWWLDINERREGNRQATLHSGGVHHG